MVEGDLHVCVEGQQEVDLVEWRVGMVILTEQVMYSCSSKFKE